MKLHRFCCLVIVLSFFAVAGFASAQDAASPPPPSDAPPTSLQQPAPENDVRAVRLSSVYGSVKVLSDGQVDFQQAELNMPLVQGMKVVTTNDGRAEIEFEDGSVARVTPNSSLTLAQLSREADGTTVTVIEADSGLTYYELDERAGQYTVAFGQDKVTPIDGAIFRLDLDSAPAELAVMHGSVHASNDEGLDVEAHTEQTLQFDANNLNEYQLLESVAANSWDQWNSDRDEALAQIAANAGGDEAENSGEPWSDLNAYGDWYDVPGYGMGWSPNGVGADWDPYGVGSWGYYNNIGYTWISPYSWGWWPYHCGAWSWFDGFGWLWFPGNCGFGGVGAGYGWYPYGTIWSVPPGYVCPRRPKPIRVHNKPTRNPKHGPVPAEPLIAVSRAPQFATLPSPSVGPVRALHLNGQTIAPVQAGARGSSGFRSSGQPSYPGSFVRPAFGRTYRPVTVQPANRPGSVYMPPQPGTFGRMRVRPAQPLHNSAPEYRAPAQVYRAPAPSYHAPAYHAPAPAFHAPAPAPSVHTSAPEAHPK